MSKEKYLSIRVLNFFFTFSFYESILCEQKMKNMYCHKSPFDITNCHNSIQLEIFLTLQVRTRCWELSCFFSSWNIKLERVLLAPSPKSACGMNMICTQQLYMYQK